MPSREALNLLVAALERRREAVAAASASPALTAAAVRLAFDHGLTKEIRRSLDDLGLAGSLPEPVAKLLEQRAAEHEERGTTVIRRHLAVRACLEAAAIEALFLKGPALSVRLFGEPNRRSFFDVDVLVRRRDLDRAMAALEALGYRRRSRLFLGRRTAMHFTHNFELVAAGIVLDLHWTVGAHYTFRLHEEAMFEAVEQVDIEDATFPVPGPASTLLMLAVGAFSDLQRGRLKLKSVFDLDRAIDSCAIPWRRFLDRCEEERVGSVVASVIGLTKVLIGRDRDDAGLGDALAAYAPLLPSPEEAVGLLLHPRRVTRNKRWAFRRYDGSMLGSAAWWAASLPVKMAVFR